MRKLIIAVAAVMLAVPVAAPVAAACPRPAPTPTPTPTISIVGRTGPIYLYDGSANGTGPALPAVHVEAVLRNCPPGDFWLGATLVQDGVSMGWATGALGAGEIVCGLPTAGRHHSVRPIGMGFYGATLHPGRATAHFALLDLRNDVVIAEATRTVWIPRPKHTHSKLR